MQIVGFDSGKFSNKIAYSKNNITLITKSFKSKLYEYVDTKVDLALSEQDLIIEFEGRKFFGGDLGEREGEIPISFTDASKLHNNTLINVLTGLHQIEDEDFNLVIGSPISQRTKEEKQALIKLIKGRHKIRVNYVTKEINIIDVNVSPEGAAGYYSHPISGEVQGMDFGSSTTNYFYMINGKFVNKRSGTFSYGSENSIMSDSKKIEAIFSQLSNKFKNENPTMLMGGKAKDMFQYVREYYPKAFIVQNPIFASAIGFYKIARGIYE